MDIRHDIAQIQQCMGICPQENWLWPQLTSFEHLLLFAALRGLPRETWPQTIAGEFIPTSELLCFTFT
jgi:ABC-type multidrug transport system ATPase subunit